MLINSSEYFETIEQIKSEIMAAQYKAAVSVNQEMILLYHSIGEVINAHKVWDSQFIESLAKDIRIAFPNVKGYSVRNLKYMVKFAISYPDHGICADSVCTNSVVIQYCYSGQGKRLGSAGLVHPKRPLRTVDHTTS